MVTLEERPTQANGSPVTIRGILGQCFMLYRLRFGSLLAFFLLPALGRFAWMLAQRALVHRLHPQWPQPGITVNAVWGLSIYWSTLALTCAGLAVYFVLAGPALAMSARSVLRSRRGASGSVWAAGLALRSIWMQLLSLVHAWGIFAAGLLGTFLVGATFLVTNPDRAFPVWYALAVLTFMVGIPVGIWLTVRNFLVIPAASSERLKPHAAFSRSAMLTRGIRLRLSAVVLAILSLRWILGFVAIWLLSHFAIAYPDASNLTTFLLFPLAICTLDGLCGPLWGIATACVFANRIGAEVLCNAPGSFFV